MLNQSLALFLEAMHITLHYIYTLHYITIHYITLHYITLHYITLHYITLHYILIQLTGDWGFSVTDYIKYYAYLCYLLSQDYLFLQQL
jgi:hypothetical protein